MEKPKRKSNSSAWMAYAAIGLVFLVLAYGILKLFMSRGGGPPKRETLVTLLDVKPPPPPPPPPELPPPPPQMKEEIVEPTPEDSPEDAPSDEEPASNEVGSDEEGSADGTGLRAKKGGKAIGGGGKQSLLRKFAWYTQILQKEVRSELMGRLRKEGGVPAGKHEVLVRLTLDDWGKVSTFEIVSEARDSRVNQTLARVLGQIQISEPPPSDMPKGMTIRVASNG